MTLSTLIIVIFSFIAGAKMQPVIGGRVDQSDGAPKTVDYKAHQKTPQRH